MSTTIYVVATNYKDQHGTTAWFWDRHEALDVFARRVADIGDTHSVNLYRVDADDVINEFVHDSIADKSAEILDSHEPGNESDDAMVILHGMLASAKITMGHDTKRLEEYRADFNAQPAPDTAAMLRRTEAKLEAGTARINALEYAIRKLS